MGTLSIQRQRWQLREQELNLKSQIEEMNQADAMKQTPAAPAAVPPPAEVPHGAHLAAPGVHMAPPPPAGRAPLFVLAGFGVLLGILASLTIAGRSRARAELES